MLAPGYFIAPGPSEQSIFTLNKTFASPSGAWAPDLRPHLPPLDGPGPFNPLNHIMHLFFSSLTQREKITVNSIAGAIICSPKASGLPSYMLLFAKLAAIKKVSCNGETMILVCYSPFIHCYSSKCSETEKNRARNFFYLVA